MAIEVEMVQQNFFIYLSQTNKFHLLSEFTSQVVRISIFCLPFSCQVSKAISSVGIVVAQSIIVAKPKDLVQRTLGWPYFQVLFQIPRPIKFKV